MLDEYNNNLRYKFEEIFSLLEEKVSDISHNMEILMTYLSGRSLKP
jgi:hypothetical protein